MPSASVILCCQDSLECLQELAGEGWLRSIALVLTDPPFGISNKGNTGNTWNGYTSQKGEWDELPDSYVQEVVYKAYDLLKPGGLFGSFGVFGSLVPIYSALVSIGATFQSHIIWEKSNPAPSVHRRMYTHANEIILLYSKGSKWMFNYDIAKSLNGGKQLKNVWQASAPRRIMERTRKPVAVLDRLISVLTKPGDWVLDPFCGTGSILEQCYKSGRNCIGIDNDPEVIEYCAKMAEEVGAEVIVVG